MTFKEVFSIKRFSQMMLGYAAAAFVAKAAYALPLSDTPISVPVFNCQATTADESYVNFESGAVRPLAASADKKLLFVANTAANCLEIYKADESELTRISAVAVGVDPVSVAVRNENEVWVVNHMSDSVSIVHLDGRPRVVQTLQVGDEPRDIVFAGNDFPKAFITTARRGQSHPAFDIQDLRTPGIGRADVWVYHLDDHRLPNRSADNILTLFTDSPRGLAVSPDGKTVYAAGFLSGNQTTVLMPQALDKPKAGPHDSADGIAEPGTGLIVRFNGDHWVDELGQIWDDEVLLSLPDLDVFKIDAEAQVPTLTQTYSGVGTVLFNMVVNPKTGSLYVSNTEARNEVRFEGPGSRSTSVRGHFLENQITVIDGTSVKAVHLNPHVDFSLPFETESPAAVKEHSISQPMFMETTRSGDTLFLAAFGSAHVVAIDTDKLEKNQYDPYASVHMDVPGGPAGLVLSDDEELLYVYSVFENTLSVLEVSSGDMLSSSNLYNPESEIVRVGRPFLYDAKLTSGNGTVSCGGCHVFGDLDGLAWDLGNPDGVVVENPLEESPGSLSPLKSRTFHPLKGPMTTQTFRGISLSGPMHWRGDRTGVHKEIVNGALESEEAAAFKEFNEAFPGLLGRGHELEKDQLQKFTDFALAIQSPPNPIANIDGSYTERQQQGRDDYLNAAIDRGVSTCDSCHKLDPAQGLFGTDKKITSEGPLVSQDFKIPHLRNMYQKVGMFGTTYLSDEKVGDQIKGFGYGHDGTFASVDDFLLLLGGFFFSDPEQSEKIAEFVFAFPSEQASSVGQQVTVNRAASAADWQKATVLAEQDQQQSCDLIVNGNLFGFSISGNLVGDRVHLSGPLPSLSNSLLQTLSTWGSNNLTYTCVPLGTGQLYGG